MELLNLGFFKFVVILAICVLPGVIGVFLIVSSDEKKREMRNRFCNKLFGVSNAIESAKFARFLYIMGSVLFLFSAVATWFLYLRKLVTGGE